MYFRLDQLGKNVLRDFFVLVGAVETEVEVPPGDAQQIDLWHVPNPDLLQAHPEIEPGLLRSMAAEPGMVEVWSATPDTAAFHECIRKHRQWHHTLELRTGSRIPLPSAWLVSAGRPRRVEFPWLVRLSFEVPAEVVARLPADERDFIMETREWYEQFNARRLKEAKESWQARLCGKRLGRPLTDAEKAALTDRLDRLGEGTGGGGNPVVLVRSAGYLAGGSEREVATRRCAGNFFGTESNPSGNALWSRSAV